MADSWKNAIANAAASKIAIRESFAHPRLALGRQARSQFREPCCDGLRHLCLVRN
jgi:hypothetical protein